MVPMNKLQMNVFWLNIVDLYCSGPMSSINNNFVFGQSRPGKYSTVYNNNPDQKFYNMCK